MEATLYKWMFIVGGGILAIQVLLQLIGLEHDADIDVDADLDVDLHADGMHGNLFFGFLSVKAIVAFIGVFGLTGMMLLKTDIAAPLRVAYSTFAGLAAFVLIGWMMKALHSLSYDGSVKLANALGGQAVVYLRIPGSKEGRGKITIEIQGRTVELAAITDGPPLPTGRAVQIVEVLGDETVKVTAS